jgi:hypothetical protein
MFFGLVADLVDDGYPDCVFGDAAPGFFWRNDGAMSFTDIAGAPSGVSLSQTLAAGGIVAADYDNDGDLDLFVAAGGPLAPSASCGGCPRATNQLFHNGGAGSFVAQVGGQTLALLAGIEATDEWRDLCAGDVDNDGRMDLFVGRDDANRLFLNVGDQTGSDGVFEFVEVAAACGMTALARTRTVQMADLDGDGDLDLFAANEGGAHEVYRNDLNNRRNLTVKVRGKGLGAGTSPVDAIGARVDLMDATATTVLASRELSGGRGFGSQDPLRAHFGVTPSAIYTVRVRFSSGAVVTESAVVPRDLPGQTLTVLE